MNSRNMSFLLSTGILLCAALICVHGAFAQATTASITGRVTDPSDAVIVGAEGVASNQATGVSYRGKTNELGDFNVAHLPPGSYSVSVSKAGFDTSTIKDVALSIDQKQLIHFRLKIGAASEVVTITDLPTMLQTRSMETGEVIDTHDI